MELKRIVAAGAARLGVLPQAADLYLFLRELSGIRKREDAASLAMRLPPALLRVSSTGTTDRKWFVESGAAAHALVETVLEREALSALSGGVLDFGCGCGRVLRHVGADDRIRYFGVDRNVRAIAWCRKNLRAFAFERCALSPPLPFAGEKFRLIYAFSVFTHLPEAPQKAWLVELAGRLEERGVLMVSTHGESFRSQLSPSEVSLFDAGQLVVRQGGVAGTNVCASYHPPGALERLLPAELEVVEHRPQGAIGNPTQDLWVLRRM